MKKLQKGYTNIQVFTIEQLYLYKYSIIQVYKIIQVQLVDKLEVWTAVEQVQCCHHYQVSPTVHQNIKNAIAKMQKWSEIAM